MSQTKNFENKADNKDTRQIEARLDETRGAISEDIKALGQKISPDNIKQEAKVVLTGVKDSAKEVIVDMAHDAKHAVVDATSAATETVVGAANASKDAIVEAATATKETIVEAASSAKETLVEAKDVAAEKLHEYKDVAVATLGEVGVTARRAGAASWGFAKVNAVPLTLIGLGGAWLFANGRSRSSEMRPKLPNDVRRRDSVVDSYSNEYDLAPRGRIATYGTSASDLAEREYLERSAGTPSGAVRSVDADPFRRGTSNGRMHTPQPGKSVTDGARQAVDEVSERAHAVYDRVGDKVSEVTADASELAKNLVGRAGDAIVRGAVQSRNVARDGFVRLRDGSRDLAEENPLALGAAALAVGIGIGLLLPSTNKENQLLGGTRDHLMDEAREAAQGVRAAAHTLGEAAKETAEAII